MNMKKFDAPLTNLEEPNKLKKINLKIGLKMIEWCNTIANKFEKNGQLVAMTKFDYQRKNKASYNKYYRLFPQSLFLVSI